MDNKVQQPTANTKPIGPRHLAQPYDVRPNTPTRRVSIHPMIWILAVIMGVVLYLMISFGGPWH